MRMSTKLNKGDVQELVVKVNSLEVTKAGKAKVTGEKAVQIETVKPTIKKDGISVVYDPKDEVVADVVVVHGLMGSAIRTWTKLPEVVNGRKRGSLRAWIKSKFGGGNPLAADLPTGDDESEDGVHWPRDLLHQDIKNIRIMMYGYDADVSGFCGPANQNSIGQHASNFLERLQAVRKHNKDRPLIFIAHSLGGILVKETLRESHRLVKRPAARQIYESTHGIIFLGCPHRGSDAANLGLMASRIVEATMFYTNRRLLRQLTVNDPMLVTIQKEFNDIVPGDDEKPPLKIYSFIEEKPLNYPGFQEKVVNDFSSTLGIATHEVVQGINANHMDMTKFGDREDEGYIGIKSAIEAFIEEIIASRSPSVRNSTDERLLLTGEKTIDNAIIELAEPFKVPENIGKLKTATEAREEGTCEWVTKQDSFVKWVKSTSEHVLWLTGTPGRGKTVLSSYVVNWLKSKKEPEVVLYFFFDGRSPTLKTANSFLSSLINQLAYVKPELVRTIKKRISVLANSDVSTVEFRELLELIMEASRIGKIHCIIDGLDECEEEEQKAVIDILCWLDRKVNYAAPKRDCYGRVIKNYFKIMVSSRNTETLNDLDDGIVRMRPLRLFCETESSMDDDLEKSITVQVERIAKRRFFSDELRKEVTEILVDKAQGMFLYASLVVKALKTTPVGEVLQKLQAMPTGILPLYDHMLQQFDENCRGRVMKILCCIASSLRPLSLEELAYATDEAPTAVEIKERDKGALVASIKGDLGLCGPILEIRRDVGVTFVHETAKEYFVQNRTDVSRSLFVGPKISNLHLARSCLAYLSSSDLAVADLDFNDHRAVVKKFNVFPFLHYAAKYLLQHIDQTEDSLTPEFREAFLNFSKPDSTYFASFLRYFLWIKDGNLERVEKLDVKHLATCISRSPLALDVLKDSSDTRDDNGLTVLHWAAKEGSVTVTRHILEKQPDSVRIQDNLGQTPLHYSTAGDFEQVSSILLEKCSPEDIMIADLQQKQPLHHAAANGAQLTVEILVRRGVDVKARCMGGNTPLHLACKGNRRNYVESARLLLESKDGATLVNERNDLGESPLHFSARNNSFAMMRLLLRQRGVLIDLKDGKGQTPLMVACELTNGSEVVKVLLENGADIKATDNRGRTPLLAAAIGECLETLQSLLDHGANISQEGAAALHAFASGDDYSLVATLLERGASVDEPSAEQGTNALHLAAMVGGDINMLAPHSKNIHATCSKGRTALHYAAYHGQESAFRALMSLGLDPKARAEEGKTVLHLAAEGWAKASIIEALVPEYLGINVRDEKGRTALHLLLSVPHKAESLDTLKLLLKLGADVKLHTDKAVNSHTAIHMAAHSGWDDALRLLLASGSSFDERTAGNECPLHLAASAGKISTCQILLDHGADIDALTHLDQTATLMPIGKKDDATFEFLMSKSPRIDIADFEGMILVHWAAFHGHLAALRKLLPMTPDLEIQDKVGYNILHNTVANDNPTPEAVKMVLEAGADPLALSSSGWSALHYSTQKPNHGKVIEALIDFDSRISEVESTAGSTPWLPLQYAAYRGRTDYVKIMLEKGVKIDKADSHQVTALHWCANTAHTETLIALLDAGAPMDAANRKGNTPLHIACLSGQIEQVRIFLERGMDINLHARNGNTPLYMAARKDHLDLCKFLVEKGANHAARNNNGCTPIFAACAAGNLDIVEYLIEIGAEVNIKDNLDRTPLDVAEEDYEELKQLLISHGVKSKKRMVEE